MEPSDFVDIWDVNNECGDCIVHFRSGDKAVEFMMTYGSEDWLCLKRTVYFADTLDLDVVFDAVTVETEGEWVAYSEYGPKYGGAWRGGVETRGGREPSLWASSVLAQYDEPAARVRTCRGRTGPRHNPLRCAKSGSLPPRRADSAPNRVTGTQRRGAAYRIGGAAPLPH